MNSPPASSNSFDALREDWPSFGFAAYAFDPKGGVTIEVIIADEVMSASGPTLGAAVQALAAMLRPSKPMLDFDAPAWSEPPRAEKPDVDIFG